jgi:competence protein ComEA
MLPALRETASRITARVVGSRFAKPIARVVLAAAGLLLLAFIGKTAVAGAMAPVASLTTAPSAPAPAPNAGVTLSSTPTALPAPAVGPTPPAETATLASVMAPAGHTQATADDPVFLNTATLPDLRRLPGIGDKKATAILALRTRLGGRLHAVEDLLKVKGIGRATLRRLRPLVRLDPLPAPPDAGTDEPHR